jgi:hypothetical protein
MIKSLVHYELEMAVREQEQLCRQAALWHEAQHPDTTSHRLPLGAFFRACITAIVEAL